MSYYVQIFDKAFGPFTKEKIQRLIELNKINGSTIVSVDGENWQMLESFPEFFGARPSFSSEPQRPSNDPAVWNYSLDGIESVGPISFTELYGLVQSGFLHGDTIVWKEGDTESAILRDVPEFAGLFPSSGQNSKNIFSRLWGYIKTFLPFIFALSVT